MDRKYSAESTLQIETVDVAVLTETHSSKDDLQPEFVECVTVHKMRKVYKKVV